MDQIQQHLYVLILAGGGGTRLWPQSREANPKQFMRLFGGKSLFELAMERALKLTTADKIIINTSAKYYDLIRKEAKQVPAENIICEPMRRDTALAEAVGALYAFKKDPEAVVVNLTSDHLITPVWDFARQVHHVARIAQETNMLVTIGIRPNKPHTGLGHIRARKPYPGYQENILLGEKFVEKPPYELAEKYTESGEYYWNAHIFTWKAKLFLDLIKKHAPKTYSMLPKLLDAIGTEKEKQTMQLVYQMAPSIATDVAVCEKLTKFVCVPARFKWSDVGDWAEIWKNLHHDQEGNVVMGNEGKGEYIGLDSKNNLLILDRQMIATIGLSDMVVVDTGDAILICPRKDSQSVKQIVQILKEKKMDKYL